MNERIMEHAGKDIHQYLQTNLKYFKKDITTKK